MEFSGKLRELRKRMGLTQEEVAERLCVSRTAISKWESGRGYPNLDSLVAIGKLYDISVDALLSNAELIDLATEDSKQKRMALRNLAYSLLDMLGVLLLFLPLFAQRVDTVIRSVPLLMLTNVSGYIAAAYYTFTLLITLWGIMMLVTQNAENARWVKVRTAGSLFLTAGGTLLFIITSQPYAAAFLFAIFVVKVLLALKRK